MNRFCFFCGEGYDKSKWPTEFECSECKAVFVIPVMIKEPEITLDEAITNFNKIPLTDKKAVRAAKRRQR